MTAYANGFDAISAYTSTFVFGASGYGQAMSMVLTHGFFPHKLCHIAGFIDDDEGGSGSEIDGAPVLSFNQWQQDYALQPVLVSVGGPEARYAIVTRLQAAQARFARLYDHLPKSFFSGVDIGCGSFIGPSTYIGPLTTIGEHVQIMSACSIGHDVVIGDFCTICPSCTVSGYVVIEPGVFLGAGTTVVNGRPGLPIRIGEGAKISAGSVVTKSVPPYARLAGNPARPIRELARDRARISA